MRRPRHRGNPIPGAIARSFCLLILFLLSLSSCAAGPVPSGGGNGLAVWDLEDLSPGEPRPDLGEIMSARVIEVLQNKGVYTVVERTRLIRVLEELRIGSSTLADEGTRLKVGRLVGARYMVFGGYQAIGGMMRVDMRLVEVETGRVLKAVQKTTASGELSQWLDAAAKAAAEL